MSTIILSGLFVGVFTWFLVNISGGKEVTLESATSIDPLIAGNIASLLTSLIVTVSVSLASKKEDDVTVDKGLKIINPLTPWTETYRQDIYKDRALDQGE